MNIYSPFQIQSITSVTFLHNDQNTCIPFIRQNTSIYECQHLIHKVAEHGTPQNTQLILSCQRQRPSPSPDPQTDKEPDLLLLVDRFYIAFIQCYSPLSSRLTALLLHVILNECVFLQHVLNIHQSGVFTALFLLLFSMAGAT